MGCRQSSMAAEERNFIDARLVGALIVTKRIRTAAAKEKAAHGGNAADADRRTFDQLLMKFPKLAKGFKKSRELFKQFDLNGDAVVDFKEFKTAAHSLGLTEVDALNEIFSSADIDGSRAIDVMEFILLFVIIHLLYPDKASALDADIIEALEIVEDFFCSFDASSDGYLERAEVEQAMSGVSESGTANTAVAGSLFSQLDWDGNGHISFKEFLLGLERMVMEEYEGEEDAADTALRHVPTFTDAPTFKKMDKRATQAARSSAAELERSASGTNATNAAYERAQHTGAHHSALASGESRKGGMAKHVHVQDL